MKRSAQSSMLFGTAVVLGVASYASAHPGHHAEGFASGLSHPVGGLDHVLAMVGVGVLAVGTRRRSVWALPALFVAIMVIGATLGAAGRFVPSWVAENGIALSVFATGLMVTLGGQVPAFVIAPLVGLFAICHGSAHAAEMPANSSIAAYFGGFVLSTILLHAVGIALGFVSARSTFSVTRVGGMAMSLFGALMLIGVI